MMRLVKDLLLLACLAPSAHATDNPKIPNAGKDAGLCKPMCSADRQACRAEVQNDTEQDTSPLLSMNQNTNPLANAVREVRPQSELLRPTDAQAFRARRAERLQACEVPYRRCTSACS